MTKTFPHIDLLHELEEAVQPILTLIEPLHSYLYCLNVASGKKDRLKPSGFYFLLGNAANGESGNSAMIDLYKDVTCITIILSEIEKHKAAFASYGSLNPLLSTAFALKKTIPDISSEICKVKQEQGVLSSKILCKKLFLYTESVRALLEELITLKSILLEEVRVCHDPFLTKEPLDLMRDLE